MDADKILSRLVQIGYVSAVDPVKKKARVRFPDTGITSGWLYILQHGGTGLSIVKDGGHTHGITVNDTYTGGGSGTIEAVPDHKHTGSTTTSWLPKVNEKVVVLYLPVADGDGFILGGI